MIKLSEILILLYQKSVSPWIGPVCRFHPSCSQYALEAIGHYGFLKGFLKTCGRLLRCHPLHPGGYDPIVK